MQNKITVVGAGNVGASCALYLAQQELGDVVLLDVIQGVPQGKALDILQTGAVQRFSSQVTGTNDYADTANSDIVIITAGLARKPGMDRLDLLKKNTEIVGGVAENIAKNSPNAIIIVVSNPVDVMVYLAYMKSGFPAKRVIGQAGVLDSSRYAAFIAMELGVSVNEVNAMVLGGHGDSMLPLPRFSTVSGIPVTELIQPNRIKAINDRAKDGGGEIVRLLGTGSAYYAPAAATVKMAEAILKDSKAVLPCSVYLDGQYGIKDLYIGVPVKLGRDGVSEIIELNLDSAEKQSLLNSAEIYHKSVNELKEIAK